MLIILSVYFALALLAFSDAVQINYGPQIFSQPQKEYRLYLTPDAIRSFENAQSSENLEDLSQKSLLQSETEQSSFQNYGEDQQQQITQYTKSADDLEHQGEFRGLLSPSSVYSNGEQSSTFGFKTQYTTQSSGEEQLQQLINQHSKSPNGKEPQGEFRELLSPSSLYSEGEQNNNFDLKKPYSIQSSGEEQQQQLINQYSKSPNSQEPQAKFRGLLSPSSLYSEDEQNNYFDIKKPYSIQSTGEEQHQQIINQYSKSSNSQEPQAEFRGLLSPSSLYSEGEQNNNFDLKKPFSIQSSGEEQQQQLINQYTKSSNIQEPQAELRGLLSPSSAYYKEGSNIQDLQNNNYDFSHFYQQTKQQTIENIQDQQNIKSQKESDVPQQFQLKPYSFKSDQTQEEALLHKELQQHWNRILDHNQAQLKTLPTVSSENTKVKDADEVAQSYEQAQSNSQIQAQKTETEKQIENIMRNILSNSINIEQKTENEKQMEYIILKNSQSNIPKNNQNTGIENQLQKMLNNLKENSIMDNQNSETQKQLENILKNIQSISIQNSMNIETLKQMDSILKEIQANSIQSNQNSENEKQIKYVKNNVQSTSPTNNQNITTEKQKEQILKNSQLDNQKKNIIAEFEKQKEILIKDAHKSSLKNQKSNVEQQIENILKHDEVFEREKEKALAQARAANERPPIIIHKEVSITKHLPVYKHVKVAVPTPVLVPVPEPYAVKVPHVYPVPLEIVKHIPVPFVRKH